MPEEAQTKGKRCLWTPGNDGVRITVIDVESGTAISTPVDFSNRVQSSNVLHFGKVSKLQYLNGASLRKYLKP